MASIGELAKQPERFALLFGRAILQQPREFELRFRGFGQQPRTVVVRIVGFGSCLMRAYLRLQHTHTHRPNSNAIDLPQVRPNYGLRPPLADARFSSAEADKQNRVVQRKININQRTNSNSACSIGAADASLNRSAQSPPSAVARCRSILICRGCKNTQNTTALQKKRKHTRTNSASDCSDGVVFCCKI